MSGKTIEVINTDAEGRLRCDALTYVERFKPAAVIDIATLTGALASSHWATTPVAYTAMTKTRRTIICRGVHAEDKAWRMPLWEEYQQQLKSPVCGCRQCGRTQRRLRHRRLLLARFTENYAWAHLDIAGTAWHSTGSNKGRERDDPVPLLVRF